jgi:uncharacterized heparinase superfamily protein
LHEHYPHVSPIESEERRFTLMRRSHLSADSFFERLPPQPIGAELLRRRVAFARHVPARKYAARFKLGLQRRACSLWPPKQLPDPGRISWGELPLPLFPARRGKITRTGDTWEFEFVGRRMAFEKEPDWRVETEDPSLRLWAMNLHYMEYLEELTTADVEFLVQCWLEKNPPYMPRYWHDVWNSYATSLRVVVWLQQATRGELAESVRGRMMDAAARQVAFLEQNLEADIEGNHLVKNIKALLWAAAATSGGVSSRWLHKGLALLRAALERQLLPDGMHYERSASYHAQVFADLLEIRHALGRDPFDGLLDHALIGMAQVTADLTHPDGFAALFNDSGLVMAYSPNECLDAFERLLGRRPERRSVFDLPQAGYCGAHLGNDSIVADLGPIAPDDLPGHGHSDIGSFEWSVAGTRFIVDQGVFEYVDGPSRRISRAAAAHNTLAIAGHDQADFFGDFRCGRRPRILERRFSETPVGFEAQVSHDGWSKAAGGPVHSRRVIYRGGDLVIEDRLSCEPTAPTVVSFLLHPAVAVEKSDGGLVLSAAQPRVCLRTAAPIQIEDAVWWPDMGVEHSTRRLVVSCADPRVPTMTHFEVVARG